MRKLFNTLAKKALFTQLKKLAYGQLIIEDEDNQYKFGVGTKIKAKIRVRNA